MPLLVVMPEICIEMLQTVCCMRKFCQVGKKTQLNLTQSSMRVDILGHGDLPTFCQCLLKVYYYST